MKFSRISVFLLVWCAVAFPQLITWSPYFPSSADSITVIFDATQGNAGLAGYTGDVYAHTGVITNLSTSNSDWKYVKTGWGVNTPETKLTRIGTDLYKFVITPAVRSFYNVPVTETILKVAFVFRSASAPYREGKTADGGDIFLPLAESGLNVKVITPDISQPLYKVGDTIRINAVSAMSTTLQVFVDNVLISSSGTSSVTYNYVTTSAGKKWVKAVVTGNGGITKTDSAYAVVRGTPVVQDLPSGIIDGINYTSTTTATLSLFAPEKEFVYVLGDFNNWEVDPAYYMKRTPDGKRYWLELNNLSPGIEYAYQYYVDGKLRVADYYADKVLDPWNDKYISSLVYPALKAYPTGKTTQIVSVLQTNQQPFPWVVTNFTKPNKQDLVVYELLIRDFLSIPAYRLLQDTIPYLKRLGVNAIQLMPVMEFEGNESWGYNPAFYLAPDKYYGPKNELKRFIDKAHQNGIAVILDIALNHSFGSSPMVRMYWDAAAGKPAANSPWFNQDARHPFNVGYDFNHESQATKDFVDRVVKYWIQEYKVDGYRFDLSKGFTQTNSGGNVGLWGQYDQSRINLLKRMADVIRSVDPGSFIILEHFADNSEETVLANYGMLLWGNHNSAYNEASMGWHDNNKSDFGWISWKNRGWSQPNVVGYMESHDEERLMVKNILYGNTSGSYNIKDLPTALNRQKLVSAFFYTVPGPKMLWQFGELGYDITINYPCGTNDCRTNNKPPKWEYLADANRLSLFKTTAALIKLKKNYDAFRTSDFTMAVNGAMKRINLYHSSMNVSVIGNFHVVAGEVFPNFSSTGWWYDYLTGDSLNVTNTGANISLAPGEFRIYTSVRLPKPDVLTSVEDEAPLPAGFNVIANYPNPFNPSTTLVFNVPNEGFTSLTVFDALGKEVAVLASGYLPAGTHRREFTAPNNASGIYFYKMVSGSTLATGKMLLLK